MTIKPLVLFPFCLLFTQLASGEKHLLQAEFSIEALSKTVWIEEFDVSPDGKLIAFKSAKAGTYDIWTVSTSGGEPRQLTSMQGREMRPKFTPNGEHIVFEADIGGTEVRDIFMIPSDGGESTQLTTHPLDDYGVSFSPDGSLLYFSTQMFWDNSIAVMDLRTKDIHRLGAAPGGVVSPDGQKIVFTGNEKADDDDQSNTDIYVMPSNGGEIRLLTPSTLDALDREPVWSPDSKMLAFISDRNGWNNLGVINVATGEANMLLQEPFEHGQPRWSPDGKWISFTKNIDYNYHLMRISVDEGEVLPITQLPGVTGGSAVTGQTRGSHLWLVNGNELVATHSNPSKTSDLWVFSISGEEARQITDHQHPGVSTPSEFAWPELMEYESFDGLEVAGLVYKPQGTARGDRLPALFFFRANSNGQHPIQWHPYIQYFVKQGFLVFAPNFRGSTGRGKHYRQALYTHGGDHDLQDAFLGMDLLAEEGWVDPDRVGAFGGSTGGFYTTTAVTKDPERFRAGVVWYGSTDLVTLSSYGSMESWNKFMAGQTPLENPENYYNRSIIYHAARIDTPLLFLYAQGDKAARFQQIEQYGVQAAIHGNWFDWVVYGEEPHGWYHWRPDSIEQSLRIMSHMFDTFLLGEKHDIKNLASQQREGVDIQRNPEINLWNSLVNGRR